ncbi:DUF819 domain-containing protein [Candidatus Palauibacter sp.]|uniref:DUF819 family protein n=1 Tax=Candidatus Palauibacter sp. TaxID=3101350 RepID=UPI003B5A2C8C
MTEQTLYIVAVLCLVIAGTEWLVRRSFLRHGGTALMVIIFTAVIANFGLLPTSSTEADPVPAYDAIFGTVAPLAIVWLLLKVNLRDILRAGLPIITLFLIGSLGTVAGVILGMAIVDGPERIGPLFGPLGGMFTGTYTGGSVNFNAVALEYDVMREGVLFGGASAVDSIMTTVWMAATIAIPRLLRPHWPQSGWSWGGLADAVPGSGDRAPDLGITEDTERVHPVDLALVLAIGFGTLWASQRLEAWTASLGVPIPDILILTVIALILAQFRAITDLAGSRTLGLFSVYLFLCVIGAHCDVRALADIGPLGLALLAFTLTIVVVHGFITFGAARLLRLDVDIAAVASQANVGGGTSALALARSLGRGDLVLPAVLIGSLGNALGTFLGLLVARVLPGLLG